MGRTGHSLCVWAPPQLSTAYCGEDVYQTHTLGGHHSLSVFAFVDFSSHADTTTCRQVNFTVADSSHAGFITAEEADRLLRNSGLYPVGRQMDKVDGAAIEQALRRNSFIDSVQCYKSPGGVLNVLIQQRLPLLRVMADNGDDYYIDEHGHIMNPQGYSADLVVATGSISRPFAQKQLVRLGNFLRDDPFWNNQIEQIYVTPQQHLTLVPRVGGHTIDFGDTDSISLKFRNLYTFTLRCCPRWDGTSIARYRWNTCRR